jgi:hypothetical protein
MRATISRAEVMAFARSLGADPAQTKAVYVQHDAVAVETYKLNEQGVRYVESGTDEAATDTTVIPIVGDMRRDTVAMRHPKLPGRVIDVGPRGVGQRAMAGWEVVSTAQAAAQEQVGEPYEWSVGEPPPKDPPPKDPPPESGSKPEAPAESGASSSPPPRGRRTKKKEEDG